MINSKNESDIFLEVDLDLFIRKTVFKIMSESYYLTVTNNSDIIDFTEISIMTIYTVNNRHVILFTLKRVDDHYEFMSNINSKTNPVNIFKEIYTIDDYRTVVTELSSQLINTKTNTSKEISYDLFIMISSLRL